MNKQVIELITNQMNWTANTIGELYRSRWQVEIFFGEIKQPIHIKSFIGTTENAVMIPIREGFNNHTHPKSAQGNG